MMSEILKQVAMTTGAFMILSLVLGLILGAILIYFTD